jgi:hypothetical protein
MKHAPVSSIDQRGGRRRWVIINAWSFRTLVVHRRFGESRDDPEHLGGHAMLSDRVRECLRHGEECMRQVAAQTDPKLRRDYLIIAACWLKLIRDLERQDRQFTAPAKPKEGVEERASLAL